jgi:MFS family permease
MASTPSVAATQGARRQDNTMSGRSQAASRLRSLAEFLGLRRNIVALLAMVILVGTGEKMAERFLPIYVLALGGTTLVVGLLNGMDNLLSALYSFPGGYLSDRLGIKRSLIVFNLLAMVGFLVVILVPAWQAVLVGAVFFLSWTAISLPASMGMVSAVLPKNKRTMGVSVHSLVRRIPMALGPVLGGLIITRHGTTDGVRLAFAVALLLAGVALVLQQRLIRSPAQVSKPAEPSPLKMLALMSPALRTLLVADILVRFCEQIPYPFVVIWAITQHDITPVQFGILTTVEMVTATLVYIPVAYLADRSHKKPFVVATFCFFTLFPLVLLFSRSFWPMLGAFVIRGLKEFGEPTRKALIMDLAPEGRKAGMFGAYYLARDVPVSVAAFCGALLWNISPATNLLVAFGFGLLATLWYAVRGTDITPAETAG